jgi:hypothetical protein
MAADPHRCAKQVEREEQTIRHSTLFQYKSAI